MVDLREGHNIPSKPSCRFRILWTIAARKHWMSLWFSLCSALLLPSDHALTPCFGSTDRIQPLGLLKPKDQEGNATSLGTCAFKKCVSIKDSLFLGKLCFRHQNAVLTHGRAWAFLKAGLALRLVEAGCAKCAYIPLCWDPCKPQLMAASGELLHIFCAEWVSLEKTLQPFSISLVTAKSTTAVLMLCRQWQTPDGVSGPSLRSSSHRKAPWPICKSPKVCSPWQLSFMCSYLHKIPWRTTHYLLLTRQRNSCRVKNALIRWTNLMEKKRSRR